MPRASVLAEGAPTATDARPGSGRAADAPDGAVRAIRLPDGRALAFESTGDPAGTPVLHHHGGVSSRLEARRMAEVAARLGVRLIVPDRPGTGDSDRAPERPIHDWAADARALLDQLAVDRVAILGWSMGAPFALAAAAALGERVTKVGLLSALGPLDRPGAIAGLGLAADRLLLRLAPAAPRLADLALCSSSRAPTGALRAVLRIDLPPCDRAVMDGLDDDVFAGPLRHALSRGCVGPRMEYAALSRAWGFDLARVVAPVTLWHGADDRLVPPEHSRHLATLLPRARVELVPGRGHFLPHTDLAAALQELVAP